MAEYRGFDFLDYLIFLVRNKKIFFILTVIIAFLSYIAVYFLIPPRFDSKAVIVSAEENKFNLIGSLSKSISNLPLNSLGIGGLTSSEKYDLFTTFVFSRTNLENMAREFDLQKDYNTENMTETIKVLADNIETEITDEMAFIITTSSRYPSKAAKMTNYLITKINDAVIELNVKKSRDNRIFLQERYEEIKNNLRLAEESMQKFQERSGILEAENQLQSSIEVYAKLEAELATKQVEQSIVEKVLGNNSVQYNNIKVEAEEFKKKLDDIKKKSSFNSIVLSLDNLPENAMEYFRHYRDVEIQSKMLEFLLPLYEQARYEEIKNIPVLQIIDYGNIPEKKSFPPRTLFTAVITILILFILSLLLFSKQYINNMTNPKLLIIKNELLIFGKRK